MTLAKSFALAVAACAITAQPALAQSQRQCVSEAEVSAMVIYAVPHALRGVQGRCAASLPRDGFLAVEASGMAQRYAALGNASWRQAYSGLMQVAGAAAMGAANGIDLARLPPELVRPLVDEMIAQKVGEQVRSGDCARIERVVETLSELEPAELGEVSAVVAGLVGLDRPQICPVS